MKRGVSNKGNVTDVGERKKYLKQFHNSRCATIFGLSKERCRQLREEYDIGLPATKDICTIGSITETQGVKILKLINKKTPIKEIANKLWTSVTNVYSFLKKMEIDVRTLDLKTNHKELNKARRIYNDNPGISFAELSRKVDVHYITILRWEKKGWFTK